MFERLSNLFNEKKEEEGEIKQKKAPIKIWQLVVLGVVMTFMIVSILAFQMPESSSNDTSLTEDEGQNTPENIPLKEDESDKSVEIKDFSTFKEIDTSGLDPKETYIAIREEFFKIKNTNDLVVFAEMYGSEANISTAKRFDEMGNLAGGEEVMSVIFSTISRVVKSVEVTTESANKAVIKVTSDGGREGEVIMVFERGSWKLDSEKW
ncbi:MAG: hypothetical protein WC519_01065 [Parcubacteria group bacterium]